MTRTKPRSIYFHGPPAVADAQVRACRDGRMTQHRIPCGKIVRNKSYPTKDWVRNRSKRGLPIDYSKLAPLPFGPPGTILALKEAFSVILWGSCQNETTYEVLYAADYTKRGFGIQHGEHDWLARYAERSDDGLDGIYRLPPQHMPLGLVRMHRLVKRGWVERLWSMATDSETKCVAMGMRFKDFGRHKPSPSFAVDVQHNGWYWGQEPESPNKALGSAYAAYANLWDGIYGKTEFAWSINPWVFACEWEAV